MPESEHASRFLRLNSKAALKVLEQPFVYHIGKDELYEINEEAMEFLSRCDGSRREIELTKDHAFVEYCLAEELLEARETPEITKSIIGKSPIPSLRYLELQLTQQCNLRCRHCYLGPSGPREMELPAAVKIVNEFVDLGGLRLIISGGEPMLYSHLQHFLSDIAELPLRKVLLTNGMLIDQERVDWLAVDEVQVSLDGWEQGHDYLRGVGSFAKALKGIAAAQAVGIPVSIATTLHKKNLNEIKRLGAYVGEIGATEWGLDPLVGAGNALENQDLLLTPEEAAPYLDYGFGGGYHGSSDGYACGLHLMTILPDGRAVKCGFYEDKPLGDATKGLRECWLNAPHILWEELDCRDCEFLEECAGGCRFRAESLFGIDPYMCVYYGVKKK